MRAALLLACLLLLLPAAAAEPYLYVDSPKGGALLTTGNITVSGRTGNFLPRSVMVSNTTEFSAGSFSGTNITPYEDGAVSLALNVSPAYLPSGTYLTAPFDTLSVEPHLLSVSWGAEFPASTSLTAELRSSASSGMASPSPWAAVTSGQTTGFPQSSRYIQLRFNLSTNDTNSTPVLKWWNASYEGIQRVEVSAGGGPWVSASGTANWSAAVAVPDGPVNLTVRATGYDGSVNTTNLSVTVDSTPPEGGVQINGGAASSNSTAVELFFNATDRYGVANVSVSANGNFTNATWLPYAARLPWNLTAGDGTKSVYVRFRDANGLAGSVLNDSILLDTAPPAVTVQAPLPGAALPSGKAVAVSGIAEDPSGVLIVQYSLDNLTWVNCSGTGKWSASLSPAPGNYTLRVRAYDGAGNSGPAAEVRFSVTGGGTTTPPAGKKVHVEPFPWLWLAVAAGILAGGVLFAWREQRKGPTPDRPVPVYPPSVSRPQPPYRR